MVAILAIFCIRRKRRDQAATKSEVAAAVQSPFVASQPLATTYEATPFVPPSGSVMTPTTATSPTPSKSFDTISQSRTVAPTIISQAGTSSSGSSSARSDLGREVANLRRDLEQLRAQRETELVPPPEYEDYRVG
jgi:hypothetical protein